MMLRIRCIFKVLPKGVRVLGDKDLFVADDVRASDARQDAHLVHGVLLLLVR